LRDPKRYRPLPPCGASAKEKAAIEIADAKAPLTDFEILIPARNVFPFSLNIS
jgi:hypothetical protein